MMFHLSFFVLLNVVKMFMKNLKRNGNGHLVKNKDNHILYSVIWVNISEKINFLQYI